MSYSLYVVILMIGMASVSWYLVLFTKILRFWNIFLSPKYPYSDIVSHYTQIVSHSLPDLLAIEWLVYKTCYCSIFKTVCLSIQNTWATMEPTPFSGAFGSMLAHRYIWFLKNRHIIFLPRDVFCMCTQWFIKSYFLTQNSWMLALSPSLSPLPPSLSLYLLRNLSLYQ